MDVLLLSQLARRPSHGYELRRRVEAATGIKLHNNSLYPALRRFGEAGAVTRTLEPQEGRPPRHVYTLTDVGRELLHDQLADLPEELAGDEAEFLARLAGFGRLSPDERRGVLAARGRVLAERRTRLAGLAEAADDPWAGLVLDEVLRRIREEQAWLDRLASRTDDPTVPDPGEETT
ncbi:PadR family transcriptional regulator [Actinomycetospora lutea]|uniref:PadR family transcriptional regulator n=1 Tax=Actinomycetospora lutea TaxID=663604 RepID=UPI0023661AC7|nr:PadR family transcriptional regulator [Actinomycetospora lutea]MDD7937915.1 PadR family transcriptional regulator [Actinomycetospora lutea]